MFLGKLNENEQTIFMQLASIIIKSDSDISTSEEKLFSEYGSEMGRTFDNLLNQDLSLDQVLAATDMFDGEKRKIIFFELLGLAVCDNCFAISEQKVIETIRTKFKIDLGTQTEMLSTIDKLMKVYVEIGEYF